MPADEVYPADFEIGKVGLGVIVVGMDGTPPALNAVAWAAGMARREQARLVLVYVEPLTHPAYWVPVGMAGATEISAELVEELRQEAATHLDSSGVPWELVHHRGDPAHGLEAVAEELRADCIVVGRARHRAGLYGTVPRTLINDAKRPVVVVP